MGTVLWVMGLRGVAKELYRSAVDGIRYGTIHYADIAGGVGQGLLLWYAGVTTKDCSSWPVCEFLAPVLTRHFRIWPDCELLRGCNNCSAV
jgi:hypothetical protein